MSNLNKAVERLNNGDKMKNILNDYPELKRSTIYYQAKKYNNYLIEKDSKNEIKNEVKNEIKNEKDLKNVDENNIIEDDLKNVDNVKEDYFNNLNNFEQQEKINNEIFEPDINNYFVNNNNNSMEDDFGYLFNDIKDSLDAYNPTNIVKEKPEEIKNNVKIPTLKSLERDFIKQTKKQNKEQDKTAEEIEEDDKQKELKRFRLIHQIRLYVYNYDLTQFDLIKPTKEKFLISLYSKKETELIKILDFIKFHIRFLNTAIKTETFNNILLIGTKFIEHTTKYFNIDLTGLSEDIKQDDEIQDLLKELYIEFESNKPVFGAKTDLSLKVLYKISQKYTMNKMMKTQTQNIKQQNNVKLSEEEINNLKNKYENL